MKSHLLISPTFEKILSETKYLKKENYIFPRTWCGEEYLHIEDNYIFCSDCLAIMNLIIKELEISFDPLKIEVIRGIQAELQQRQELHPDYPEAA